VHQRGAASELLEWSTTFGSLLAMKPIRLRLFGRPQVGDPTSDRINLTARDLLFLGYMAYMDKPVSRESLVRLFWPNVPGENGSHSLSQTIYRLGRSLDTAVLEKLKGTIRLNNSVLRSDLHSIRLAIKSNSLPKVIALIEGPFLGESFSDLPVELQHWLDSARADIHTRILRAGSAECGRLIADRNWRPAKMLAKRLLRIKPSSTRVRVHYCIAAMAIKHKPGVTPEVPSAARRLSGKGMAEILRFRKELMESGAWDIRNLKPREIMIGRSMEALAIHEVLQDERSPGVLLVGDPGVGKTSLMKYVLQKFADAGGLTYYYKCQSVSRALGYAPVIDSFRHDWAADAYNSLPLNRRLLPPSWLPTVPISETPAPPSHHSFEWSTLAEGTVNLLDQAGRDRQLLYCIDDIQWADASTLGLVLHLATRVNVSRIKFLLAMRTQSDASPELQRPLFAADAQNAHFLVLPLQELDSEEASRLVAGLAGEYGRNLPMSARREIIRKAAGLPLFLRELTVQYLGSTTPATRYGPSPRYAASDSLLDYVGIKFKSLDVITVRLAEIMAVHGGRMVVEDWAALAQMTESQATKSCWSLLRSGICHYDDASALGIKHDVIKDVLYNCIPDDYKRMLHELMAKYARKQGAPSAIVAFHYDKAGRRGAACNFAMNAASESVSRYAYLEAAEWYLMAARSSSSEATSVRLRIRAAACSVRGGALKEARSELSRLMSQTPNLSQRLLLRVRVDHACVDARISDYTDDDRIARFRNLAAEPAIVANPRMRCRVLQAWILFAAEANLSDQAPDYADYLNTVRKLGASPAATAARIDFAKALSLLESTEVSFPVLREAVAAAESSADPAFRLWTLSAVATVNMFAGQLNEADHYFEKYKSTAENLGLINSVLSYWNNRGCLYLERADFENARTHLRKAVASSKRAGTTSLFSIAIDNLHVLYFESGEHERLSSLGGELEAARRSTYYPYCAEATRGLALLERGAVKEATALYNSLRQMLISSPPAGDRAYLEIFLTRTASRLDSSYHPAARLKEMVRQTGPRNKLDALRLELELGRILRKSAPLEARHLVDRVYNTALQGGAVLLARQADDLRDRLGANSS
jgi:tetratricopeptide (TPR) repeat protein